MALRRYTAVVDGTIPIPALLYNDEELLASQDNVGIYDGYVFSATLTFGLDVSRMHLTVWVTSCFSFCLNIRHLHPRRQSAESCGSPIGHGPRNYTSTFLHKRTERSFPILCHGFVARSTDGSLYWSFQIITQGDPIPRCPLRLQFWK
ncbi:hypothetical protein EDD17DRAFT_1564917 [Pisolithus thermaeus]|nr:hypothetical protein EDD17DRAFT_1564917 [Pisolithus thermaeus]